MNTHTIDTIRAGGCSLGIELGSTRIKAVLIDDRYAVIAQGNHEWENALVDGYWTYKLEDVWTGLQAAYSDLAASVRSTYGIELERVAALGISAMMHGYLPFGPDGSLLAPFRTWRNTNTDEASRRLSELFLFNIPHRWSVAHVYQAILDGEAHVAQLDFLTTLAGYVHWQLTGEKVIGVGDAAGMFPINDEAKDYDARMLARFDALPEVDFQLEDKLPRVLLAGAPAGHLTEAGARRLDPTGRLQPGALLCPPEGDAGTGMTATNTVAVRTGNVSAGTSIFAMLVLEKSLAEYHPEIDMVTTPDGMPVAMVHCNNGTSETDAWIRIFAEFAELLGLDADKSKLYELLYKHALTGDPSGGGIASVNYLAGEPITGLHAGRPLYVRRPDSQLNLANFMLSQLYAIVATLKLGMDILTEEEGVCVDELVGHGGIFKTEGVMQSIMASALNIPTAVYRSAGEGGAWGIAILAAYAAYKREGESLASFLSGHIFSEGYARTVLAPDPVLAAGFGRYIEDFKKALAVEETAAAQF